MPIDIPFSRPKRVRDVNREWLEAARIMGHAVGEDAASLLEALLRADKFGLKVLLDRLLFERDTHDLLLTPFRREPWRAWLRARARQGSRRNGRLALRAPPWFLQGAACPRRGRGRA